MKYIIFITIITFSLCNAEQSPITFYGEAKEKLIIGNGGAGAAGLIQHLAYSYNATCQEKDQLTLGWKFADSNMNFAKIKEGGDSCDLYITYVPTIEKVLLNQGYLSKIIRLFNDEFRLIGPGENPAHLDAGGDPVENMKKIIKYSLKLPRGKHVYFSRWNQSAMGVKDQQLWVAACDQLAKEMMNAPCMRLSQMILDEFTTHHVSKPQEGRTFPAGAISIAKQDKLYAITDGALIAKHDIKKYRGYSSECVAFTRSQRDLEIRMLTNPAQLLVPKTFEKYAEDSPQKKFLDWLCSKEGHEAISKFSLSQKNPYFGNVEQESFEKAVEEAKSTNLVLFRVNVPN